jgi:hypothetical protein
MGWETSLSTFVWIFSVGRGNAAFVRTGMNQGFIIDMGKGSDEDFDPAEFVEKNFAPKLDPYDGCKIAQTVLSHPHKDHIIQCGRLRRSDLAPNLITCPHDKDDREGLNWRRIKNPEGSEDLVSEYRDLYAGRRLPLQTIQFTRRSAVPPDLEYGVFYLRPPICETLHSDDNAYGNATSIMLYLRYGANSILFPGDMTPEAMAHVLRQAEGAEKRYTVFSSSWTAEHPRWHDTTTDQWSLQWLLRNRGLSILVAPHHGLESCYSPELYAALKGGKPQLVVISEKRHTCENDGSIHQVYQSDAGASGLAVEVDGYMERDRKSISTRDGRHILTTFNGSGVPRVYAHADAGVLLARMNGAAAAAA